MTFFREIFLGEEKNFSREVILFHSAIFLSGVLFLYLFSYSTSPRYDFWGNDSAIFQVVGRCWAEGLLPYADIFENKGSLIFFIDALGWSIYPRYGIFILQVPFMYFSFLFMWRSLELYWSGKSPAIIFLLTILFRASVAVDGNRTEEYSVFFLTAAAYLFLRRLRRGEIFTWLDGFIYGLSFGACVLLRTTNGLPVCCYAFMTTIFLLQARVFKALWKNFLSFCAGGALICLPFIIFFAAQGALADAIYGTITLNVKYIAGYEMNHPGYSAYLVRHALFRFTPLTLLIFLSLCLLFKSRADKLALSGLLTAAAMFFMLIKNRPFAGYLELIAATLPIFFAVFAEFITTFKPAQASRNFSFKRLTYKLVIIVFVAQQFLLLNFAAEYFQYMNSDLVRDYTRYESEKCGELAKIIPPEERDSVMYWGDGLPVCHWILITGIVPSYRFFENVWAFANVDPEVKRQWLQHAQDETPLWIIYSAMQKEFLGDMNELQNFFRRNRDSDIEKLLAERYNLAGETELCQNSFRLYRRK